MSSSATLRSDNTNRNSTTSTNNRDSTASSSFNFGFKRDSINLAAASNRASTASAFSKTGDRKVVLITGATGAIGRATSVAFARTGKYDLALHYNSADQEARQRLLREVSDAVVRVIDVGVFQADLAAFEGVRKLHSEVVEQFGGVDVLFNNAGATGGVSGVESLAEVEIDVFERVWRINTGSPILLSQLCLPHMEAQGWGRIIFNSSLAAFTGGFVGPHYASSKSGLHGFVHWLGQSVARKGITVNAVAPAMVSGGSMLGGGDEGGEQKRRIADKLPVGRLGMPEEIAETVIWMVNTGYLTRKIINVDGGVHPY